MEELGREGETSRQRYVEGYKPVGRLLNDPGVAPSSEVPGSNGESFTLENDFLFSHSSVINHLFLYLVDLHNDS